MNQTVYHTTLSTSQFIDKDSTINIVRLPGLNRYTLNTFTLLVVLGTARFASIFRVPASCNFPSKSIPVEVLALDLHLGVLGNGLGPNGPDFLETPSND